MQNASFNIQQNCCVDKNKQAPIIGQTNYSFSPNYFTSGITQVPYPLITPLISGEIAYAAGIINNDSCYDLNLSITYLDNQNCTNCGVSSFIKTTKNYVVYANTLTELPTGYIIELNMYVGTMGANNIFTNQANSSIINVNWHSFYNPDCNNLIIVP